MLHYTVCIHPRRLIEKPRCLAQETFFTEESFQHISVFKTNIKGIIFPCFLGKVNNGNNTTIITTTKPCNLNREVVLVCIILVKFQ